MKIELTKAQIEAIQKLLSAHAEIAGSVPNYDVCWRAFESIESQTGISKITQRDYEKAVKRLASFKKIRKTGVVSK